ncbi:ASCH domain-containing protein [Leucobacter allii]|uniref:ASCH domain-containing protein n=1 Tax=Leucobacter allii TaxID=2932247 RepID=A0ABY4FP99_9MICO|nr:ASCH domain-containing protein [Leucobacter allii]UOQ58115.1 ASCH domain-containing protein [Leucobacter allii]
MTEMRILTVRQPWAWAIIHGGKDVENRVRNIAGDYRGLVAIHAGMANFEKGNAAARLHKQLHGTDTPTEIVFGAILGVVDLVDVHTASECAEMTFQGYAFCSSWAEADAHHLVLENPRPLASLVPFKGALGLRRLDETTTARVLALIGDSR